MDELFTIEEALEEVCDILSRLPLPRMSTSNGNVHDTPQAITYDYFEDDSFHG